MIKLLVLSSLLILAKCNGQGKFIAGGACSYDSVRFKAIVIQIETVKTKANDTVYAVKVKLNGGRGHHTDTLQMSHMTLKELNSGFLRKQGIKVGKIFTGKAWYITKGTCNPEMYNFDDPAFRN